MRMPSAVLATRRFSKSAPLRTPSTSPRPRSRVAGSKRSASGLSSIVRALLPAVCQSRRKPWHDAAGEAIALKAGMRARSQAAGRSAEDDQAGKAQRPDDDAPPREQPESVAGDVVEDRPDDD